jgi:iron complex transport system ATP-binding protein
VNRVVASDVSFGLGGRWLVDRVSLTLAAGSVTIVIGPNGAGKSTLLKLLAGEFSAHDGSILYDGEPIDVLPAWRLSCKRAVMAQAARLAFPLTVFDIVRLGADGIGRSFGPARRHAIVAEALSAADVRHLAGRPYASLSGGEQQRVQFARALCQLSCGQSAESDQVLFLDEPTASLDLAHQVGLMQTVCAIARRGVAVLAILHDINLAAAYGDTIIVMRAAKAIAQGSPRDVFTSEVLSHAFDTPLRVGVVPADRPFVLPLRNAELRQDTKAISG